MNTSWYAKSKSPTQAHILHFMDISIELKPSKSKHLRISITPTYINHHLAPKITLSHHFQTPSHKLMDFLHLHKQWILSTHQKFLHQTQHINTILQSHKNQILLFGQWQEAPTKSALKITLMHYITHQARFFAQQMRLTFSKLAIRESTTRFGSCTQDRLSFSLMLVFAPKECIDYVIIHELAHIRHKNHSAVFWNEVKTYCHNYRYLRASLKKDALLYRGLLEGLKI